MRTRVVLGAGATAALVLVGTAAWAFSTSSSEGGEERAGATTATVAVARRDLVERETFDGTLGYADGRIVTSGAGGTVTWLPREGAVVKHGEALYEVDERPVTLLYGSVPAWRTLRAGVDEGADVRQLEQNLVTLGYDRGGEIEVDDEWDWATTAAVKRWQEDAGITEDGVVDLGEVVFLPGARRVGAAKTTVGARAGAGAPVLETSSTKRIVTVQLDARRQSLVAEGDKALVELPDGRRMTGRVVRVGKVANATDDGVATIEVEISVPSRRAGRLDRAPAEVAIAKERRKNVLTVPVTALLAQAGGGYAVEVDDGGSTRIVPVEAGLSANGHVEISGRGIAEGMRVVVPR